MDGSRDVSGERGLILRVIFLLPLLILSLTVFTIPGPVHAATAANQLCIAAGYGPGCIGAFSMSATPRMATPSGGGMFGGIVGAIVGSILIDALTSGLNQAPAQTQPVQEVSVDPRRVQAFQQALQEQQKLQQERESKLLSQLLDRPASQIIGGTQGMGIMESLRAEAGRPFDGNASLDEHEAWMTFHDAWFSPEAATGLVGSEPLVLADQPPLQGTSQMQPIQCMGNLCAFPPGSARVPVVMTGPPTTGGSPATVAPSYEASGVVAEWRQVGNRLAWSARRDIWDAMETARQPEIPAVVLGSGFVDWAQQVLPGMQQEVAREGRGIYQRLMEELIGETFGVLSDAASGRWQEALERSDTIGERVRESILSGYKSEFKMTRLLLAGDAAGAGQVSGEVFSDHATEVAKERLKDGLLDRLTVPEWVREGTDYSIDMVDHWLQLIRR